MLAAVTIALVTLRVLLVVNFRGRGRFLLDGSIVVLGGAAAGRLVPWSMLRRARARRRVHGLPGLALVLLSLALALPAGASAFISTGDGVWVWQNPLPQGNGLTDVAFRDARHGWAVGHGGTILATTDGGATWNAQSSGAIQTLYAVAFPDAAHGWAVGLGGAILATTRGSPPPTVSGFTPMSGSVGTLVTINGLNLTGITGVAFDGTPAVLFDEVIPTQIRAIVPSGATTGPISVTTAGGTGVSASAFIVTGPGPTPGPTPGPIPTPTPGPSGPSVIPATGGTGIASSTALAGGSGTWTTLSGPTITEGSIGAWPIGERITLKPPANFGWNQARTAPLTVSGCDRNATAITYSGNDVATVTLVARSGASQLGVCTISFGTTFQVRPLNGSSSAGTGGPITLTFVDPTLPMSTVFPGGAGQISMVTSGPPVSSLSLAATSPTMNNNGIVWDEFVDLVTTGPAGAVFSFQVTVDDPAAVSSPDWETLTTSTGGPLTFTIGVGGTSTCRYTPIRNYWYRAIAGTTTSNTPRVTVRQTIAVRPQSTSTQAIRGGTTVTFTATVRPARPELQKAVVAFELYRRSGNSWVLDRTVTRTIDSSGIARWAWTASSTESLYVRAQARPTSANASSFRSPRQSYDVG